MCTRECIALVLAGGQGSRLGVLTTKTPKPALHFGGKYRIIDFTLSNCTNSNLDTVGVLTQYQPFELHRYIGNGQPWDLDRSNGGIHMLSPHIKGNKGEWYKGTAHSICQNISFVEQFTPRYVVVLSGDHIYKMDYSKMLEYHQAKEAAATISVTQVKFQEAKRFGIACCDSSGRILKFEEKPARPLSCMASMGIYVFNWEFLRKYLIEDEKDASSNHDFGKDIIPKMIRESQNVYAYNFEGYWKDVGTIPDFWEANMELLQTQPPLNLYDNDWNIYFRNSVKPPNYIGPNARVIDSIIADGAQIFGEINNSLIFSGAVVEPGATVTESVVFPNVVIRKNACVHKAIVAENVIIGQYCTVGGNEEYQVITVIGDDLIIEDYQGCRSVL